MHIIRTVFQFEGKLDDLLVDNGKVKSSRLIEFGKTDDNGNEQNWDVQLTSFNSFEAKHERFDKMLGKTVRITVETID